MRKRTPIPTEALRSITEIPELTAGRTETPAALLFLQEEIRRRAYELYEQRGREDGYAEEDWLQAEAEILAAKSRLAA